MKRQLVSASEELKLRRAAENESDYWVFTNGYYITSIYLHWERICIHESGWQVSPTLGVELLPEGFWVFQVPATLRDKFDADGKPRTTHPVPDDADRATVRLMYSSIPKFRGTDICPVPGCSQRGYFKQMALCCLVHGPFANNYPPPSARDARR